MANVNEHFLCSWKWAACWTRTLSGKQPVQVEMILSHFQVKTLRGGDISKLSSDTGHERQGWDSNSAVCMEGTSSGS